MKKITLMFLLLDLLIVNQAFAQLSGTAFGGLANKRCTGIGLSCGGGIKSHQSNDLTALTLNYSKESQTLSIDIKTSDVSNTNPEVLAYLNTHSSFIVDSEVAIESAVLNRLQLPENTVIPPGTYKVTKREGGFEISIPLKIRH